jgi:hypothetical protein
MKYMNEVLYAIGFLLYVAAQAQNSVKSKSNGLQRGWSGISLWLRGNAVNLATRAFFSALAYGFLVHTFAAKIQSAGFAVGAPVIAGCAGYAANALLYQFFGLFPGLRVEISDLSPPANSQILPPSPPTSETRA